MKHAVIFSLSLLFLFAPQVKHAVISRMLQKYLQPQKDVACRRAALCVQWALGKQEEGRLICSNRDVAQLIAKSVWETRHDSDWLHLVPEMERSLFYYDMSCRSSYNLWKPLLWLARKLLGVDDLHFVEAPVIPPPEISADMLAQMQADMDLAQRVPLPDDEESNF